MANAQTKVTLVDEEYTDAELKSSLLAFNGAIGEIKSITIRTFWLSDASAKTLASFVARSSIIEELDLAFNHITVVGFRAIARALYVNSSLRVLNLYANSILPHERLRVDKYMRRAIEGGVGRPTDSKWCLYVHGNGVNDYERLKNSLLTGNKDE